MNTEFGTPHPAPLIWQWWNIYVSSLRVYCIIMHYLNSNKIIHSPNYNAVIIPERCGYTRFILILCMEQVCIENVNTLGWQNYQYRPTAEQERNHLLKNHSSAIILCKYKISYYTVNEGPIILTCLSIQSSYSTVWWWKNIIYMHVPKYKWAYRYCNGPSAVCNLFHKKCLVELCTAHIQ